MRVLRAHTGFLPCLAASLAAHLLLIAPAMLAVMGAANAPRAHIARFESADHRPLPEPVEIQLGLDAPNPPTPTWVGYEQYQKHVAEFSKVEQAAFTDDPVAASEQSPDLRPIAPAFDSAQAAALRQQLAALAKVEPAAPAESALPAEPLSQKRELDEQVAKADEATEQPAQTQPAANPGEPVPPAQQPRPEQAVARQATGAPNSGAQSDRESDPTSTIDVPREHWQLGKPLAAHGLEIKPRRPDVTVLTQLTAWPRNPTARITFDRTGVPTLAVLVRDTGDSRVDAAIVAALYRWRAAGKRLQELKSGETIDITIRLLINPERKRVEGE